MYMAGVILSICHNMSIRKNIKYILYISNIYMQHICCTQYFVDTSIFTNTIRYTVFLAGHVAPKPVYNKSIEIVLRHVSCVYCMVNRSSHLEFISLAGI